MLLTVKIFEIKFVRIRWFKLSNESSFLSIYGSPILLRSLKLKSNNKFWISKYFNWFNCFAGVKVDDVIFRIIHATLCPVLLQNVAIAKRTHVLLRIYFFLFIVYFHAWSWIEAWKYRKLWVILFVFMIHDLSWKFSLFLTYQTENCPMTVAFGFSAKLPIQTSILVISATAIPLSFQFIFSLFFFSRFSKVFFYFSKSFSRFLLTLIFFSFCS